MTQIEIWLRLAQVNELYGDEMVRIAHWLNTQPCINNAVLLQAGFSLVSCNLRILQYFTIFYIKNYFMSFF